ncbi:MAG: tetraacyldisaccharide 4-kinase [Betaproteobacteria bacterium]|nr:tetraacyldisaccharide 4-kinase [Betaproteobacteria bacterium]
MRSSTAAHWTSTWQKATQTKGWQARLLWPVSLVYQVLVRRHRQRYLADPRQIERMPVPVIVVGNIVVGGAGKTPTTLALLRHLRSRGWRPGVVSRGYGRSANDVLMLPDTPDPALHGDEPSLLKQLGGVPVCVGARRAEAGRQLLREHPEVDVMVCDDGLQHFRLGRDLAIAVFDDRGVGNGWLLPAGLLREPWPPTQLDALSPHLVLRIRSDASALPPSLPAPRSLPQFEGARRLAQQVRWSDGSVSDLSGLQGQRVHALAGIARPEGFFSMLQKQGLSLGQQLSLADHADIGALREGIKDLQGMLLCTEKDAVKLFPACQAQPVPGLRVGSVRLEMDIEPDFFAAIDRLLLEQGHCPRLSSPDGQQTA